MISEETKLLISAQNYDKDFSVWCKASIDYYDIDLESDMSDDEFDELTETLKERYRVPQSEEQNLINGIVNKGITLASKLSQQFRVEHNVTEQVSLNKIKFSGSKSTQDIRKFFKQNIEYNLMTTQLLVSPKLDGISLKIKLNDFGVIDLIQTRGGQNVTSLLRGNADIKSLEKTELKNMTFHGELVIDRAVFKAKYADEYENPRNCIVGVMKTNPNDLRFVVCTNGFEPLNRTMRIWEPLQAGTNLEQMFYTKWKNDHYPFQVDGMVIGFVLENKSNYEIKNNYPTNLTAIKFKSQSVKTKVTDIEWSIKKSGKLTPVLHIVPVNLDGSTMTKCNGYSYGYLKHKKIGIGSEITIHKSGDIIPTVDKVLSYSLDMKLPKINWMEDGKHIRTIENTEDQRSQKFILGLRLLQLDGIGPVISDKIGALPGIDFDIINLFNTNFKPDIKIALGSDSANWNRFDQFYTIKKLPLDQLIEMLQLNNCGKTLSRKFAQIMVGDKIDVKGMNRDLLKSVCTNTGEFNIYIKNCIERLKNFGISVIKPIEISEDSFSFEMTGNPPGMTKAEFIEEFKKSNPNSIHSTLTKNTKVLIVDDINSNTSKANKARSYNVQLVTYLDALKNKF